MQQSKRGVRYLFSNASCDELTNVYECDDKINSSSLNGFLQGFVPKGFDNKGKSFIEVSFTCVTEDLGDYEEN